MVVEFKRDVSDATLRELHRLSWNFSHCPAVITIEPTLLRVWTCCIPPNAARPLADFVVHRVEASDLIEAELPPLEQRAARAVHWINLVSGQFFRERAGSFDRDGRADQLLLGNLRYIRDELIAAGLKDDDVCHDLLARIIFVQFLFDRKDSDGNAALRINERTILDRTRILLLYVDEEIFCRTVQILRDDKALDIISIEVEITDLAPLALPFEEVGALPPACLAAEVELASVWLVL